METGRGEAPTNLSCPLSFSAAHDLSSGLDKLTRTPTLDTKANDNNFILIIKTLCYYIMVTQPVFLW